MVGLLFGPQGDDTNVLSVHDAVINSISLSLSHTHQIEVSCSEKNFFGGCEYEGVGLGVWHSGPRVADRLGAALVWSSVRGCSHVGHTHLPAGEARPLGAHQTLHPAASSSSAAQQALRARGTGRPSAQVPAGRPSGGAPDPFYPLRHLPRG